MDGYTIRLATHEDLEKIRVWLEQENQENKDGITGNFFCSYCMIEDSQRKGFLAVLVRDSDALPVAFCLGGDNIDIFVVKADCRRQGLGCYLAQNFIDLARKRDAIGLYSECTNPKSRSFWKKMGYVSAVNSNGNDNWIVYLFHREHDLPDSQRHTISIALEDAEYNLQPVFQCDAVQVNGRYVLAHDYVEYIPSSDRKLNIRCDGKDLHFKKSKYISEAGGERVWPWVRVRELYAE